MVRVKLLAPLIHPFLLLLLFFAQPKHLSHPRLEDRSRRGSCSPGSASF